mgnify:CR=1 FL=1
MCLAKVYLKRNNDSELVMDNVTKLYVSDGTINMTTVIGEKKEVRGTIREVDLKNANIILESTRSN